MAGFGPVAWWLGKAALTLFSVIVLSFVLIRLAPGDPALLLAGDQGAGDAAFVEEIRHHLGLDQPLAIQLWSYLKAVASFDFGMSYRDQRPVIDIVLERVPATLLLTVTAFVFSIIAGVTLGALASRRPGSVTDAVITTASVAFFAMPMFWIGLVFIILFAVKLGWLPSYGMRSVTAEAKGGWAGFADLLAHLILPVLTLGLYYMSIHARVSRAALLQITGLDFIRTARAKGLAPAIIWRDHLLRNALLPTITVAAMQAGHLIGGSVLVETVFAWPGIGRLAFDALMSRDYNVLLAVFILSSFGVIVMNLLADMAYGLIDPRIDREASA
ncbi:ABC transporter permease [Pararhizobium polonicum]|uniref:ABC transporter permease n=1 Tax=Pararhizobium polonicum TaxID=1612624 RepID=A0A1C7NX14_9HYPH|nr:ABC transporter permease [Pararhizobium polonicum]OBZ93529.1 ABC transporter permease [Pararhizobium polonicum]